MTARPVDVSTAVTREALIEAARAELRPGLSRRQAIVIGFSALLGERLDPERFDDAALILRAERLLLEGLSVVDAVATARAEAVTWGIVS